MKIGEILGLVGRRALSEVPYGGLVVDLAEVALDKVFDKKKVTGEEVEKWLYELPDEKRKTVMNKTIDANVRVFEKWAEVQEKAGEGKPIVGPRAKIVTAVAYMLLAMSALFGGILVHAYVTEGIMPSLEMLTVVFGIPCIAILSVLGVDSQGFQGLVIGLLERRFMKRR